MSSTKRGAWDSLSPGESWIQKVDWESEHTVALLSALHSQAGREDLEFRDRLKKILDGRPHVPNKAERKVARLAKMKEKQNR